MKISTIGDLKGLPIGSVIKDSHDYHYRKDEFKWVFCDEKGGDKPNTSDQTNEISLPVILIPQYTLEETVEILERENKRLIHRVEQLEKRVEKLEKVKPWPTQINDPNKPWDFPKVTFGTGTTNNSVDIKDITEYGLKIINALSGDKKSK